MLAIMEIFSMVGQLKYTQEVEKELVWADKAETLRSSVRVVKK